MLRVNPGGSKTWRLRYKLHKKTEVVVLGTLDDLTLAEARSKASEARALIRSGVSPAVEAQRSKRERQLMPTVGEFAEEYINRYAKQRKRSWHKDEQKLSRWVLPEIGRLKMEDVHRRDVVAVLDKIHEAGLKREPSSVFAVMRRMFRFAVERGVIEVSPTVHVSEPQPPAETHSLTVDEIKRWWAGTFNESLAQPEARLALRVLLLTGQRPGEVCAMQPAQIVLNEDSGLWLLPQKQRKRGNINQTHEVPLTKSAVEAIKEALAVCATDEFMFPNRARTAGMRTDGPLNNALKKIFDDQEEEIARRPTPHDARRTVATELADTLNFGEEIVARVLGHYSKNVTQQYIKRGTQRASVALEAWEQHLLSLARSD